MRRALLVIPAFLAPLHAAGLEEVTFEKDIKPLLSHYCYRCHGEEKQKGDLKLSIFRDKSQVLAHREIWLEVLHQLREEEMPTKEPLPSRKERQLLIKWIDGEVNNIDWSKVRNAGHVTIPRLTKVEYRNTMRDLLGMDLNPSANFTEDGEGRSGFTTDRDALFITPSAMEKYFDAAEVALESVIAIEGNPIRVHLEAEDMFMTETREMPKTYGENFKGYSLNRGQMTLYDSLSIPYNGVYEFKVCARADNGRAGGRLRIDDVPTGDLVLNSKEPVVQSFRAYLSKGVRQMAWNIQAPPPAPAEPEPKEKQSYRALPANAQELAAQRAKENAPRWAPKQKPENPLAKAIAEFNAGMVNAQKNYEMLAMLLPDGHPTEIGKRRQEVSKIEKMLSRNLNTLAKALKENPKKFGQEFRKEHGKRLAANKKLLDESDKIVKAQNGKTRKPKAGPISIDWVEVTGPLRPEDAPEKSQVIAALPGGGGSAEEAARRNLAFFLPRAFRREVSPEEQSKYLALYKKGARCGLSFSESMKLALTGVLVSPQFLFRHEFAPTSGGDEYKLNDFQLASRLSYFLWSSMPDNELFRLARTGTLGDPEVLRSQVQRMLQDPKAKAFAEAFSGQWLGFASVGVSVIPDEKRFPQFDAQLAEAMKAETVLGFSRLIRENRSLLELLDSKVTFLNERLARHYGIKDVSGEALRLVKLQNRNRGGLLGMASVLTATSSSTRTAPVSRGKWVLETILGNRIPDPPPDAGELEPNAGQVKGRTLRQELEQHRSNPECSSCHNRIDPIGFGLENFDAIGRYRTSENGRKIDSSGSIEGQIFSGPVELKDYLLAERKDEFVRNVTEKMLAFALGRVLQFYDEGPVREIISALEKEGQGAGRLIEEIVLSYPFQYQNPTSAENSGTSSKP